MSSHHGLVPFSDASPKTETLIYGGHKSMRKSWDHFYHLTHDKPPLRVSSRRSRCLTTRVTLLIWAVVQVEIHVTCSHKAFMSPPLIVRQRHSGCSCRTINTPSVSLQSAFEDFPFGHYDLVNAHFALPSFKRICSHLFLPDSKNRSSPAA